MKFKTVSLDNRVSRPTFLPPKTLSKDLYHIHFTFFRSHLSYLKAPPSANDLQTYNDKMYEEIDLDLDEDMHSVSTQAEAEFDEYAGMCF